MLDKTTLSKIQDSTSENADLIRKREYAFMKYRELPMPSEKSEAWRYTNVENIDLNQFNLAAQKIKFIGEARKKGVIFTGIKTAIKDHFGIISKNMPLGLVTIDEDKFTAMHAAFWNDGVFIYVPKNVELKIPLRNTFLAQNNGGIFSHTLIILDENSSLDYVEEHKSQEGDYLCLRNDIIEIYAKQNSKINFHNLQEWGNNVINISYWKARLERDSRLNWFFSQFGGKLSRIKIDTTFAGQGSESKTFGIFYGEKDQHYDFTTDAYHITNNTTNNILVKGALNDKATAVYRGKIKITKDAQKTYSYLADHTLLLGKDAVSNSIPSLEIDANDVKASHGATIGKPEEEDIFYLMSRGMTKNEAERLIISGYFATVTENIKDEMLKVKIEKILEKKLHG